MPLHLAVLSAAAPSGRLGQAVACKAAVAASPGPALARALPAASCSTMARVRAAADGGPSADTLCENIVDQMAILPCCA